MAECRKSPTAKHEFRQGKCIWCGRLTTQRLGKELPKAPKADYEYVVYIRTRRKITDDEAERFVNVPSNILGWHPEGSIEWKPPRKLGET